MIWSDIGFDACFVLRPFAASRVACDVWSLCTPCRSIRPLTKRWKNYFPICPATNVWNVAQPICRFDDVIGYLKLFSCDRFHWFNQPWYYSISISKPPHNMFVICLLRMIDVNLCRTSNFGKHLTTHHNENNTPVYGIRLRWIRCDYRKMTASLYHTVRFMRLFTFNSFDRLEWSALEHRFKRHLTADNPFGCTRLHLSAIIHCNWYLDLVLPFKFNFHHVYAWTRVFLKGFKWLVLIMINSVEEFT